jgi:hypothetical protein
VFLFFKKCLLFSFFSLSFSSDTALEVTGDSRICGVIAEEVVRINEFDWACETKVKYIRRQPGTMEKGKEIA